MKKIFINAVLAGITIGIGTIIYLSVENKVVGALLFSVGLLSICALKFNLFTGKVGYLVEKKNFGEVGLIWLGNLVGTFIAGTIIQFTRIYAKLLPSLQMVVETKLNDNYISLFILGIFCGILMFTAVDIFSKHDSVIGVTAIFLCVSVFILSGFEHSIANMAYFTLYGWNIELIIKLLVITIGNGIGGMLIPLFKKVSE